MNTASMPTKPEKQSRINWKYITPVIALVAGFAAGAGAMAGDSGETSKAKPEVITETVTETVVETETVEVEVLTVPTSCLVALDDADDLIAMNQDLIGMLVTLFDEMPDAMYAAAEWDVAGIERMTGVVEGINADVEILTDQVLANTYWVNAEACRLAG